MKVSLNWLKEYTEINISNDALVDKIGSQIGAVEEVVDLSKKYQGIIVARVAECIKHPDADKLSLCKIDDGGIAQNVERDENGNVQVVCGAPNVRVGLMVAWLPPGATVPSSFDKDPFVLEVRELRGKVSNGMLASAHELGISDDHNGIVELDDKHAKVGDDFAEAYKLNDMIIDIENKMFTHRPDCFGLLGVAREVAGIQQKAFVSPNWYLNNKVAGIGQANDASNLEIDVQIPDLCPRYMAVVLTGIKVGPSPLWLQTYLSRVGMRSINNIVDMTNYIMYLTGQPLHAFDFDKVAIDGKAKIIVRSPKEGEKVTLLDGKVITPRSDAVLICDANKPIALGGVMGGNNSEIDENTTSIIIECANFDMYNIRRTSMEHGIFTDAVTRFNKGQSPQQCPAVLLKAIELTSELCDTAKSNGAIVDINNAKQTNKSVEVTADFINQRLGLTLSNEIISELLTNVEFTVGRTNDKLSIIAPFWRTDIEIPEDIVEEIGRLYGYDHLPLDLPRRSIKPAKTNQMLELKSRVRRILSESGANEVLTYSFVHGDLIEKSGQDKTQAFQLSNAISPDLQYYRMSLTPSLLDKVRVNIKSDMVRSDDNEFALFEIGKAHVKGLQDAIETDLPAELNLLAMVFAADDKTAVRKYSGSPYYIAIKYLTVLLEKLGLNYEVETYDHEPTKTEGRMLVAPFEPVRTAIIKVNGEIACLVGEYRGAVKQKLKLPSFTAGFELDLDVILKADKNQAAYVALPKFPKVQQDMTLKIPSNIKFGNVSSFMASEIKRLNPDNSHWDLGTVDIYQSDDASHKNVTFRLWISAHDRTLTAESVNSLLDNVAKSANEKFGAERL